MMKRTLQSFIVLMLAAAMVSAQTVNVTLTVDVSNETVDATGVHVAGNFQDPEWQPGDTPMTDNGDGTWSITLELPANSSFEYKYLLGNDWDLGNEGLDPSNAPCTVGDGNGNRILRTGEADAAFTSCYNSCGPCAGADEYIVTFGVDMSLAGPIDERVILSGGFPDENYSEAYVMTDFRGDSVYSYTLSLPAGDYEYKFRNGPDGWENVASECTVAGGNRAVSVVDADVVMPVVCLGACEPCNFEPKDTVNVTVMVDMSFIAGTDGVASDGVFMAGSYQSAAGLGSDWTPVDAPMTDDDGDGIYMLEFSIPEGDYQFKFLNGDGGWEGVPEACADGGNRAFTADIANGSDLTVGPFCFNSCDASCPEVLDPVSVTFRVDMSNEFISPNGLYVAGDFNAGAKWVKDSFELAESPIAAIYEYTTMIRPGFEYQYKYANGGTTETEENHDFVTDGCGVNSGVSANRVLDMTDIKEDLVLPAYIYNSCEVSPLVSNNDITYLTDIAIYPNPATDLATISLGDTNGQSHAVRLLDLTGQIAYNVPATTESTITIPRGTLAAGLYVGQIINDEESTKTFKLVFK